MKRFNWFSLKCNLSGDNFIYILKKLQVLPLIHENESSSFVIICILLLIPYIIILTVRYIQRFSSINGQY